MLIVSCVASAALLFAGRRWVSLVGLAFATVAMMECLENAYEELSPRQSGLEVAAHDEAARHRRHAPL